MINLGSGKIKGLRLGSEKIQKVYLGEKIIVGKEVTINTEVYKKKEAGHDGIELNPHNAGFDYFKKRVVKYMIVDGKYRVSGEDIYLFLNTIYLKNNNPLINKSLAAGTKIMMVALE